MKALKLNLDLSEKFLEEIEYEGEYIELGGCYNNTFKTISVLMHMEPDERKDYKVAYGFIDKDLGGGRVSFRHAFLVCKKDNSVVDVTACLWDNKEEGCIDYDYYVFKEYDNIDDYTDALLNESGQPGLYDTLVKEEVSMVNELSDMGLEINPIDLMEIIQRAYGNKYFMEGFRIYKESKKIIVE